VDTFAHPSSSDDSEHDDDDDDEERSEHGTGVDLVRLRKDLYFEQAQLEQEMVQNQQLMQEFLAQIEAASRVHADLTAS